DRGTAAAKAERVWELMEKFAGYGFNKCLAADTWIEMADGTRKPITAIRDGDLVATKDGPHRACGVRPSGVRPVGRLTLANGLAVRCTPDHPIFTHRGWVNAEKLAKDDRVAVFDSVAAAFERVALRRRGGDQMPTATPMTWAAPTGYVVEGTEPTYDFEVPGAASFIANGIAVHNSHAGAYALVAYQTAYFKANYPVEFMAALLTSEMGDTDKIVKYIEECRAMGLTVSPPEVNVSAVQFSVAGDTIRFGLAAIKNVGEAAMESILATRAADGAFKTLDDFCARVDLRLVNRRVIESLIKAGAFDSLGLPRAHLLAQTDAALEAGQRVQRDRIEGQASFFDTLIPPAAAPARREPAEIVPEWPDDQRLAYEKEVLGFYVSGHPLAQYASVIDSLGVTTSGDLGTRSHGARVTLLGHVAALKETATKSGNRMAFVTLEDMAGTVEVTVFPEPFKAAAPYLRSREPLVVRGRVDDGDKGRVILAEDVRLLEQALGGAARPRAAGSEPGACRIRVTANGDPESRLNAVRRICEAHPGGVPVFVHVVLTGQEVVIRARGCSVDAAPELVNEVEALLGPAAVTIDYA
ncbi:MAG TPA: OB-fold nucleic acid binding domain-containing protein, partial [Methylomirabilota bacterium]